MKNKFSVFKIHKNSLPQSIHKNIDIDEQGFIYGFMKIEDYNYIGKFISAENEDRLLFEFSKPVIKSQNETAITYTLFIVTKKNAKGVTGELKNVAMFFNR